MGDRYDGNLDGARQHSLRDLPAAENERCRDETSVQAQRHASQHGGLDGAFAYSTLEQTTRTRHVATTTGNAYYVGMTQVISGKGKVYMGEIDIQIRFSTNAVSSRCCSRRALNNITWLVVMPDLAIQSFAGRAIERLHSRNAARGVDPAHVRRLQAILSALDGPEPLRSLSRPT